MTPPRDIWVGTYTADSGREGVGIGVIRLDDVSRVGQIGQVGDVGLAGAAAGAGGVGLDGGAGEPGLAESQKAAVWLGKAVDAASPSFVAVHPTVPVVYAVAERSGTVAAYRRVTRGSGSGDDTGSGDGLDAIDGGSDFRSGGADSVPLLEPFGEAWAAGEAVCHIAVDPLGRYAVASCWGDGRVVLYELGSDGAIVSRFEGAPAVDPHAVAAQAESDTAGMLAQNRIRATSEPGACSLMLPDGRIMTTDLGFDLVRVWSYEPGAGLVLDHEITLPFWTGPRHLISHPNGTVLIISEYSVDVVVLSVDSAESEPVGRAGDSAAGTAPAGVANAQPEPSEPGRAHPRFTVAQISPATARGAQPLDGGAEIALSDGARFLYATVRGSNSVTTLRVDDRGHVHPLADVSSGGNWPRHHLVLGRTLLVAHERSSDVTLFDLDAETGLPSGPTQQLAVGAPTALIPA